MATGFMLQGANVPMMSFTSAHEKTLSCISGAICCGPDCADAASDCAHEGMIERAASMVGRVADGQSNNVSRGKKAKV